jgi:hypothetical protein
LTAYSLPEISNFYYTIAKEQGWVILLLLLLLLYNVCFVYEVKHLFNNMHDNDTKEEMRYRWK